MNISIPHKLLGIALIANITKGCSNSNPEAKATTPAQNQQTRSSFEP